MRESVECRRGVRLGSSFGSGCYVGVWTRWCTKMEVQGCGEKVLGWSKCDVEFDDLGSIGVVCSCSGVNCSVGWRFVM